MVVVRAPLVTVTAGGDAVGTVTLGTVTGGRLVNEPRDTVGRDKTMGMLTEGPPLLLDKALRLEVELGEEVLEMLLLLALELGDEVLELLLLDEEELLELELDEELRDEELRDEVRLLKLELALELGEVGSELVEGRLGTLMDEVTGKAPLPVHTPLQPTIWPLTH